jgi:hypothetical protein
MLSGKSPIDGKSKRNSISKIPGVASSPKSRQIERIRKSTNESEDMEMDDGDVNLTMTEECYQEHEMNEEHHDGDFDRHESRHADFDDEQSDEDDNEQEEEDDDDDDDAEEDPTVAWSLVIAAQSDDLVSLDSQFEKDFKHRNLPMHGERQLMQMSKSSKEESWKSRVVVGGWKEEIRPESPATPSVFKVETVACVASKSMADLQVSVCSNFRLRIRAFDSVLV